MIYSKTIFINTSHDRKRVGFPENQLFLEIGLIANIVGHAHLIL